MCWKRQSLKSAIHEYISSLKSSVRFGSQVVYHTILDEAPAKYADEKPGGMISGVLEEAGIDALYTHQQQALDLIRKKRNVVVSTPTSSGKTLIYNLPVLEGIMAMPEARALYIFPLKALAQDQLRTFYVMAAGCRGFAPNAAIYDGDTTAWRRKKIRQTPPNVILTNPEMLHLAILAHHEKWSEFLSSLEYVVIDEVHTYRGILGSHMAQVFRRFRRVCSLYGADPVFVFSSATIGNPATLSSALTGLDVEEITETGAPEGKRHLLFVNPADSPAHTAIQLLKAALHRGLRTIVYCQSRKMTELISLWAGSQKGVFAGKISAYRAGFLAEERREIEHKLLSGDLLAVISTSALELGIDIGDLDLCILVGYPGTVMATRQRGGRVGRSGRDAAIIMLAGEDALDQYIMRHADSFINMPPESAMVNPDNTDLLEKHLVCAAAEHPLDENDGFFSDKKLKPCLKQLAKKGDLLCSEDGTIYYAAAKQPHRHIDLRGSGARYNIIDGKTGENRGEVDAFRAFRETHPGAIYLHLGESFRVDRLDPETRTVTVSKARPNYYTRVRASKQTEILEQYSRKNLGCTWAGFGRLRVTDQVTGYEKRQIKDRKRINIFPLDLPPQIFETEGIWFSIPPAVQEETEHRQMHFMGGIHAVEHAAIGICPLFVLCDRDDLAGISTPFHPQVKSAAVFVYDSFPGGIGLCRSAYARAEQLLEQTLRVISDCKCESGCPACVHSPKCGSGNRPIDKAAAGFLLEAIMDSSAPSGRKESDTGNRMQAPASAKQFSAGRTAKSRTAKPGSSPARFGVVDIETQRSAQEVGGWTNARLMGVSCAVLYDSGEDDFLVFRDHEISLLVDRLGMLDLVVGFNIKRFDYLVLSGYVDASYSRMPTLDILEDIHAHLGYRLSLEHLARVNLGEPKSADGLQALRWWKEGRIGEIIDYCKKDVEITRDLFLLGKKRGYLLFKNKAAKKVRIPVNW
ncbi:MAG: DEAD/DEAH box helicase [Desulfobacteraceae bacterium]|nr:DEAD/DEAH box helicase [Desulfobacteraceae bacterium]